MDDLTEWAERESPTLDDEDWDDAERVVKHGLSQWGSMWTMSQARALMAHIRRLAEGLEYDERAVVLVLPSRGTKLLRWSRGTAVVYWSASAVL